MDKLKPPRYTHNHLLVYAKHNGALVHISQVPRGVDCKCTCISCGEPLVARKGSVLRHHFAHQSGRSCKYGYEVSLATAAAEILKKEKFLHIPELILDFPYCSHQVTISDGKRVPIEGVELKKVISPHVPAIVIEVGGKKLHLFITASEKLSRREEAAIQESGISTVIISFHDYWEGISQEFLTQVLMEDTALSHWAYNSMRERFRRKFKSTAQQLPIKEHWKKEDDIPDCPLHRRNRGGYPHALLQDCEKCAYCVGMDLTEAVVYCTGNLRISNVEDFRASDSVRIAAKIEEEKNQVLEDVRNHICPFCRKGHLRLRTGPYGDFWGCTRYPDCNAITTINEETGEITVKA